MACNSTTFLTPSIYIFSDLAGLFVLQHKGLRGSTEYSSTESSTEVVINDPFSMSCGLTISLYTDLEFQVPGMQDISP